MSKINLTDKQVSMLKKLRSRDRSKVASELLGFNVSRQRIEYHLFKDKNESVQNETQGMTKRRKKNYLRSIEDDLRVKNEENLSREVAEVRKLKHQTFDNILVISDMHAPYSHKDLIKFYRDIKDLFNPDLVINIGDELDNHAISFHDSDPDLDSAGVELKKGREFLWEIAKIYPRVFSVDSNHGSLAYRRQKAHGLPKQLILSYRDIVFSDRDEYGSIVTNPLGKQWFWANDVIVNTAKGPIKFKHGEGTSDLRADILKERMSVIRGHHHSQFNIQYSASNLNLIFGMTVGCGIDDTKAAFSYNKKTNDRPIIGCGLVINGAPRLLPMPMDDDGNYMGKAALSKII